MKLEDVVRQERDRLTAAGAAAVPARLQGVTKARIREVLRRIDRDKPDIVDAVFALLDDNRSSWFGKAPAGAKIADGASTAHVACHVGILQRDSTKLDREGRDYWIKPLRDIGAIEAVYLDSKSRKFLPGHPVAKSPNSAYRLNPDFKAVLQASDADWPKLLTAWNAEDTRRQRLELQAELAERTRKATDTKHADLIRSCRDVYAPKFLPGYRVIYIDDADGDRISNAERERLAEAGITLTLADAMPDLLLWHPESDWLWVVEAVTSDGEVDAHKRDQLVALAERSQKAGVGFTTAYRTWRDAAGRQRAHKNIASGTYVWIVEDGSKHFLAEGFDVAAARLSEGNRQPSERPTEATYRELPDVGPLFAAERSSWDKD